MILKIHQEQYYGYLGKTKELFKKKYRSLGLKWMVDVKVDGVVVDGWISDDKSQYLLKLPEEGMFKRFTGNCIGMIEFLKFHRAIEIEGDEKGTHIDYDDTKGYLTQEKLYGRFIGADLVFGYELRRRLKDMPDNFGVVWSENKINNVKKKFKINVEKVEIERTDTEVKERLIQALTIIQEGIEKMPIKKKVIVRKKIK